MSRGRRYHFAAGLLLILLLAAVGAHAAEHSTASNEHTAEVFQWINFAIVAGILGWVFLKVTPPIFRRKAEEIRSAITKATAAKTDADLRLHSAEEKLARLQQEVTQLRATAQNEAAAEAARLRAATQSEVQKVGVAAKAEVEAAERAARLELKAVAANLAVDGAESLLAKQLTPQAQESLVAEFVKNLQGRPN